ncbi:hypothetical protein EON81_10555 [bacterium]|nr:MAG: hypothetical protein EON81_10555 [bacterium]
MNAFAQLEKAARAAWNSDRSPEEKGARLRQIHGAMVRYLAKYDEGRKRIENDPWGVRTYDRLRGYLVHLAADVQDLSLQCERSTPAVLRKAA